VKENVKKLADRRMGFRSYIVGVAENTSRKIINILPVSLIRGK